MTSNALAVAPAPVPKKIDVSKADRRIAKAIRAHLLKLLRPETLTTGTLMEIERTARSARELLILTVDISAFQPAHPSDCLPSMSPGGVSLQGFGSFGTPSPIAPFTNVLAPSQSSETYGATVIREMMAAAKKMHQTPPDPAKLIEGIAMAKKKKMHKLAKRLESELLELYGTDEKTERRVIAGKAGA